MKILFICTHNRCRSILAEAITNQYGKGHIVARSAGSQPAGELHPLSLKYLSEAGIATDGLYSKSWDEHESWSPNVVVTVCDSAAGESCPIWFGKSIKTHWGLADPSTLKGSDEDIAQGFRTTINILKDRIEKLIAEDLDTTDSDQVALFFEQLANE